MAFEHSWQITTEWFCTLTATQFGHYKMGVGKSCWAHINFYASNMGLLQNDFEQRNKDHYKMLRVCFAAKENGSNPNSLKNKKHCKNSFVSDPSPPIL